MFGGNSHLSRAPHHRMFGGSRHSVNISSGVFLPATSSYILEAFIHCLSSQIKYVLAYYECRNPLLVPIVLMLSSHSSITRLSRDDTWSSPSEHALYMVALTAHLVSVFLRVPCIQSEIIADWWWTDLRHLWLTVHGLLSTAGGQRGTGV